MTIIQTERTQAETAVTQLLTHLFNPSADDGKADLIPLTRGLWVACTTADPPYYAELLLGRPLAGAPPTANDVAFFQGRLGDVAQRQGIPVLRVQPQQRQVVTIDNRAYHVQRLKVYFGQQGVLAL